MDNQKTKRWTPEEREAAAQRAKSKHLSDSGVEARRTHARRFTHEALHEALARLLSPLHDDLDIEST